MAKKQRWFPNKDKDGSQTKTFIWDDQTTHVSAHMMAINQGWWPSTNSSQTVGQDSQGGEWYIFRKVWTRSLEYDRALSVQDVEDSLCFSSHWPHMDVKSFDEQFFNEPWILKPFRLIITNPVYCPATPSFLGDSYCYLLILPCHASSNFPVRWERNLFFTLHL